VSRLGSRAEHFGQIIRDKLADCAGALLPKVGGRPVIPLCRQAMQAAHLLREARVWKEWQPFTRGILIQRMNDHP